MPRREDIEKILIVGAGPIVIGQACEFDYSGVQACKALKEEGYSDVLVKSNTLVELEIGGDALKYVSMDSEGSNNMTRALEQATSLKKFKLVGPRRGATSSDGYRRYPRQRRVASFCTEAISRLLAVVTGVLKSKNLESLVLEQMKIFNPSTVDGSLFAKSSLVDFSKALEDNSTRITK